MAGKEAERKAKRKAEKEARDAAREAAREAARPTLHGYSDWAAQNTIVAGGQAIGNLQDEPYNTRASSLDLERLGQELDDSYLDKIQQLVFVSAAPAPGPVQPQGVQDQHGLVPRPLYDPAFDTAYRGSYGGPPADARMQPMQGYRSAFGNEPRPSTLTGRLREAPGTGYCGAYPEQRQLQESRAQRGYGDTGYDPHYPLRDTTARDPRGLTLGGLSIQDVPGVAAFDNAGYRMAGSENRLGIQSRGENLPSRESRAPEPILLEDVTVITGRMRLSATGIEAKKVAEEAAAARRVAGRRSLHHGQAEDETERTRAGPSQGGRPTATGTEDSRHEMFQGQQISRRPPPGTSSSRGRGNTTRGTSQPRTRDPNPSQPPRPAALRPILPKDAAPGNYGAEEERDDGQPRKHYQTGHGAGGRGTRK